MFNVWKFQISLFGILFLVILLEVSIIPAVYTPLRVDFLIGMVIGQIIYVPFSQGFPFVILASLIIQAFSGARIGLLPLLYIALFLALDMLKDLIYLENVFTQAVLGIFFYGILAVAAASFSDSTALDDRIFILIAGMVATGAVSPLMAAVVGRLQAAYAADRP